MPQYPGSSQAELLYENKQAFLFEAETVAEGEASIAVQLRRERGASYPFGASFELVFSADPGAFEVDIEMADTDVAGHYVMQNTISAVNSSYVARLELPIFWAKFVRAKIKTLTNQVAVSLMVTR